uniref:Uncharacterized protein n=1 Tax=Falco tinnunculus TaxID=100819 RepID=A0A8C4XJ63_FALTI
MRGTNDQLNMPTTNQLKIIHCLLICKTHRPCYHSKHNPDPLIILRSNNPHNLPQPNLLNTILPGQYQLRTHTELHPAINTRPTTPFTPNSNLMIAS